jgi:hypothetical protein
MLNVDYNARVTLHRRAALLCVMMLLCFSFASALCGQTVPLKSRDHDGIWWQEKSEQLRAGFVMGYLFTSRDAHINGISPKTAIDYKSAMVWVAGLDKFYDDFRNRPIYVGDALQYVKAELNGASDKQLETQLLHLRQTVRPTTYPE